MPQFTDLNYFHQVTLLVEMFYLIFILHDHWVDAGHLDKPQRKHYTLTLLCMGMGWALTGALFSSGFTILLAVVDYLTYDYCKKRREYLIEKMKKNQRNPRE